MFLLAVVVGLLLMRACPILAQDQRTQQTPELPALPEPDYRRSVESYGCASDAKIVYGTVNGRRTVIAVTIRQKLFAKYKDGGEFKEELIWTLEESEKADRQCLAWIAKVMDGRRKASGKKD